MKKFNAVLLLSVIGLFLSACATSRKSNEANRRFHESSHANVVLQFSSWDYTFMVQPRYDENGFLRQVRRENLSEVCNQLNVQRDMAVVVIGWTYGKQEMNRVVAEWKSVLGGCGFRRAVFLRSNAYNKLNGSLIIDDSTLSRATAQAPQPFQRAAP